MDEKIVEEFLRNLCNKYGLIYLDKKIVLGDEEISIDIYINSIHFRKKYKFNYYTITCVENNKKYICKDSLDRTNYDIEKIDLCKLEDAIEYSVKAILKEYKKQKDIFYNIK